MRGVLESSQHPSHSLAATDHQHLGDTGSINTLHGHRQGGLHPLYVPSSSIPTQGLWLELTLHTGRETLALLRSLKVRKQEVVVLGSWKQLRAGRGEKLFHPAFTTATCCAGGAPSSSSWPSQWMLQDGDTLLALAVVTPSMEMTEGIGSLTHTSRMSRAGDTNSHHQPLHKHSHCCCGNKGDRRTCYPLLFRGEHPRYIPPSISSFRKQLYTQSAPSPCHASGLGSAHPSTAAFTAVLPTSPALAHRALFILPAK